MLHKDGYIGYIAKAIRGRWRSQVFSGGRGGRDEEGSFSKGIKKMIHPSLEPVS